MRSWFRRAHKPLGPSNTSERPVTHRWTTHELVSTDHVPFIGRLRADSYRLWVATGFAKWGMTNGYVAARIISEAIGGSTVPRASAFDSTRVASTLNRKLASIGHRRSPPHRRPTATTPRAALYAPGMRPASRRRARHMELSMPRLALRQRRHRHPGARLDAVVARDRHGPGVTSHADDVRVHLGRPADPGSPRMTDIFDQLVGDHRDIERRFEQYRSNPDDAVARDICDALTVHSEVEERVLYPELRRIVDGGDDLANDAEAEHGVVRLLIARLQATPPVDLRSLIDELRTNVERHVTGEESDLFPKLREAGADAEALGAKAAAVRGESSSRSSGQVG